MLFAAYTLASAAAVELLLYQSGPDPVTYVGTYSGVQTGEYNDYLYNSCAGSNISTTLSIALPAHEVDGSYYLSHFSWQTEVMTSDRAVAYQAIASFSQSGIRFWVEQAKFGGNLSDITYHPFYGGGPNYFGATNVTITVTNTNDSFTWTYNLGGNTGSTTVKVPSFNAVAYQNVLVGSDSSSPEAYFYNFSSAFRYNSAAPMHVMFAGGNVCSNVVFWSTQELSNVSYSPLSWVGQTEAIQNVTSDWNGR